MTRREALRLGVASAASLALPPIVRAHTAPPASPSLHAYADYGWLRGFSVVPSWGARIEDAWWLYDGAKMRAEVALARQVHANCIRLWIEFSAWFRAPEKVTANFVDAVAAIAENGMKAMPCLFNRWHDKKFDYGGTYLENLRPGWTPATDYVKALVAPLAADERIFAWDLCNEPQAADLQSDANQREFAWLSEIAATVRACGARQPVIIGTMGGIGHISTYAPLVDVLCAHPYSQSRAQLETVITHYQKLRQEMGKPLLVNETIPGSLDDAIRAEGAKYYTQLLSEAGFGWMGWALREGLAISTRRDRIDANGFHGDGFHPFFTKEGILRDGLEFLAEEPNLRAPWEEK